jgi:hypothetical protein
VVRVRLVSGAIEDRVVRDDLDPGPLQDLFEA